MNNGLQITMISKYFYPEFCATGQLLMELGLELKKKGCKINVLTGRAPLVGRGKLPLRGSFKGIPIRRVWCTRLGNERVIGKTINRMTFTPSVLLNLLLRKEPLLIITSDPPFLCWAGLVLKKAVGTKYVYIFHDIHPDASVKLGYLKQTSPLRKIWDWVNRFALKEADSVIVLGEDMKRTLEKRFRECRHRVRVIHNWADGDFIKPMNKRDNWFAKKHGLADKFVVLYSGSIGGYHDLETVVMIAERLKYLEDIEFVFIGEGNKKRKILQMVHDLKLRNVSFLPSQPREYLPFSLTSGDVSIVTLEKGMEGLAVPCKLYTSLAAGLAIWGVVGKRSEISDVIRTYGCGFRTDQKDVDSAAEMLTRLFSDRKLLAEFKENSRRCFEESFDKKRAAEKYFELLARV